MAGKVILEPSQAKNILLLLTMTLLQLYLAYNNKTLLIQLI
jgi:hypothetical protein